MPVYEYQCKKCGREAEYQQRMSDPDKTLCEACGAEALERIISRTAFTLKGGGWYKDLYSSTKPEKSESSTTSESKPAAASDAASTASPAPAASTPSSSGSSSSGSSSSGSSSGGSSSGGSSSGGSSTASAAKPASNA
ncbi:MAG TPA: zinc ribbon domain-containing protein [Kofleriaceae bacterium]